MRGRSHTRAPNTAFMPAGGWWEKWDEVCDQVFGTKNEGSETIGPTLFLKHLSAQEITGFREFSRNIYSPEKLRTVRFTFSRLVMNLLFRRVFPGQAQYSNHN